jgi:hypothetical protein
MNTKYAGKTIVLPKATADALIALQGDLSEEIGFKPSLSEVVAHLIALRKKEVVAHLIASREKEVI